MESNSFQCCGQELFGLCMDRMFPSVSFPALIWSINTPLWSIYRHLNKWADQPFQFFNFRDWEYVLGGHISRGRRPNWKYQSFNMPGYKDLSILSRPLRVSCLSWSTCSVSLRVVSYLRLLTGFSITIGMGSSPMNKQWSDNLYLALFSSGPTQCSPATFPTANWHRSWLW